MKQSKPESSDRQRVLGGQKWELMYIIKKYGVTIDQVIEAIRTVGNTRERVEKYFQEHLG